MYFAQVPRPDDLYGYKVILDFGGERGSYYDQCAQPPTPASPTPPNGPISVLGTFCVGNLLLTDALARSAPPPAPTIRASSS
jgi:hypothetical protein